MVWPPFISVNLQRKELFQQLSHFGFSGAENNHLEVQMNRKQLTKRTRKCFVPVIEEAGERCLTFHLASVLLAVFRFNFYCSFDACGRLSFQAHLHLLCAEALQAGLAIPDAGHRLNTSSQFHLELYDECVTMYKFDHCVVFF